MEEMDGWMVGCTFVASCDTIPQRWRREVTEQMQVTVEIPDAVVAQFRQNGRTMSRELLEALAVEGYRTENLSRAQVGELLGLNYWETEEFLGQHGALLHYDLSDLEQDRKALRMALLR
jgi:predicted HTH domain antitoxin